MLKRNIVESEIPIFDIFITNDKRNAGYNLGDLLNMPYLSHQWPSNPHANNDALNRMNMLAVAYPNSILDIYCKNRPTDDPVPNVQLIHDSTKKYMEMNPNNAIYELAADPTTLCIHVRTGDRNVNPEFKQIIERISHQYKTVILLSGLHLDEWFVNNIGKRQNFAKEINEILALNSNIHIYLDKADIHLCIMMIAKNVLLHKGGFSCLGSIVAEGNLFITDVFYHAECENWKRMVGKDYKRLNI